MTPVYHARLALTQAVFAVVVYTFILLTLAVSG